MLEAETYMLEGEPVISKEHPVSGGATFLKHVLMSLTVRVRARYSVSVRVRVRFSVRVSVRVSVSVRVKVSVRVSVRVRVKR